MRKSKLRFWGFLAPSLIAFCIVVIIPTCIGFFYSLTNWNGIVGSDIKFVGFQNFIDIFTRDDSFVHAFLFTALFSVCAVVLVNFVGFPLMMPAFTIGLFLSISSSFKMFDQNLALTQGGPYKSTEMIALNIYNSAFGANEFGFAQAKAIVFLIIVAGIGVTQLVITKRKEVEM